jgi:hypothetical protein
MKKCFVTQTLLVMSGLLVLSLSVARASLLPCTISGAGSGADDPVVSTTVITCGALTFSNFDVQNGTGGAAGLVDILAGSDYDSVTGAAYLNFNPNLGANQDEQLLFEVTGGISQIDLSIGGNNASITERACANPISVSGALGALCTNSAGNVSEAPMGQITIASGAADQPIFSAPFTSTSPIYIFKDIETGANGQLSEFTQSFETGAITPEPVSIALLGSGLLGLVLLRRRSRRS